MSAIWAGVIGAAVGGLFSLLGVALAHYLQTRRAETLADKRRDRLRRMLSGKKYTWRNIDTLAASIGADKETTLELLIEIDARKSYTNDTSWALISRAPWPEDQQPND